MIIFLIYKALSQEIYYSKLYGDVESLGYYYTDVLIGSSSVVQAVIIDTGSRITGFPCTGCSNCGSHMDSYFDYQNSSTSRLVTCSEGISCYSCKENLCWYSQDYTEGSSISGILIEDQLRFETTPTVRAAIGCHKKETNLFRTQKADGIMGLGYSKNRLFTIIDQLYHTQVLKSNTFSLCFGLNGGFMTIGGYNITNHLKNIQWVTLHDSYYYTIKIKSIQIHQKKTLTEKDFISETIIDSGTTFSYFYDKLYRNIVEYIKRYCEVLGNCNGGRASVSGEPRECYEHDSRVYPNLQGFFYTFPDIGFEIDEAYVIWLPKYYLFTPPGHVNLYCIGIYTGGGSVNVIGSNFMRGMDIIFDRSNSKLGFAPSVCNSSFIQTGNRHSLEPFPTGGESDLTLGLAILSGLILLILTLSVLIKRQKPITSLSEVVRTEEI
jgi:Eukaryotic aspartyl protease